MSAYYLLPSTMSTPVPGKVMKWCLERRMRAGRT